MQYLASNIKWLRRSKNWTQDELGDLLDVKKAAISSYERAGSVPPSDKLYKMSKIFACTLDELVNIDLSKTDNIQIAEDPAATYLTKQDLYNIHALVQKVHELDAIVRKLEKLLTR